MFFRMMGISLGTLVALVGCGVDESTDVESQKVEAMRCDPAWQPAGPMTMVTLAADEVFDPFDLLGTGGVGQLLGGETFCPGHEPTGNPLAPCPPGSRSASRNSVSSGLRLTEVSGDPRLTGDATIVANTNFDENHTGRMWGTLHGDTPVGTWDGIWEGGREQVGPSHWVTHLKVMACGTSGDLQGIHARMTNELVGYLPVQIAYTGHVDAELFVPQQP